MRTLAFLILSPLLGVLAVVASTGCGSSAGSATPNDAGIGRASADGGASSEDAGGVGAPDAATVSSEPSCDDGQTTTADPCGFAMESVSATIASDGAVTITVGEDSSSICGGDGRALVLKLPAGVAPGTFPIPSQAQAIATLTQPSPAEQWSTVAVSGSVTLTAVGSGSVSGSFQASFSTSYCGGGEAGGAAGTFTALVCACP